MLTYVEFVSDKFPPYEDEDINPGVFGKRLAEFLSNGLKAKGFKPQELIMEDWGWMIPIENDEFNLWIGCGNYLDYENGFLCFIEPNKETIKKFLFFGAIETKPRITELQKAMDEVLKAEPSIQQMKWFTHEEFNSPK
ncbi:MAG: hypothetical protein JNL64_15170 [Blastocatellia bacterium]|nr:hypothetical protein [Blastocatellia bacterium]